MAYDRDDNDRDRERFFSDRYGFSRYRPDEEQISYERPSRSRGWEEHDYAPSVRNPSRNYASGYGPEYNYGYGYARGNFGRDNNYPFFRSAPTDQYSPNYTRPSERFESSYDQNYQRYSGTGGYESRTNYQGRGPKGWKRSDERIKEDVSDRLASDPYIDASEIEVDVNEGVVSLRGSVETRRTKRAAEDLIEDLPGVKDVRNELSIDQSLFQQAKEALMGESSGARH